MTGQIKQETLIETGRADVTFHLVAQFFAEIARNADPDRERGGDRVVVAARHQEQSALGRRGDRQVGMVEDLPHDEVDHGVRIGIRDPRGVGHAVEQCRRRRDDKVMEEFIVGAALGEDREIVTFGLFLQQ